MISAPFFAQWRKSLFHNQGLKAGSEVTEIPVPSSVLPPVPTFPPPISPTTKVKSKTWATTVTHVPSWPQHAKPLKVRNSISNLYLIGDIVLGILPIYFILLGVAVITLNGKPTKDNAFGPKVEFAIQLGPTLFPIVFAAISGRSMKMYARYLAEKGANISTLELLTASQSVWGTVESQFLMQRLTLVGAHLLFLWALSPLGGQASLRLMSRDDIATNSSTTLRYLSTGPAATAIGLESAWAGNGKAADASVLYNAALLTPHSTKIGPQDIWGNVKIPSMEALSSIHADSEGWIEVPANISTPETYSSLVGIPLINVPTIGLSSFSVEYTYLSVACGGFDPIPYPTASGSYSSPDWAKLNELVVGEFWSNKSDSPSYNPFSPQGIPTSFFIDTTSPWLSSPPGLGNNTNFPRLDGFFGNINQSQLSQKEFSTNRELQYVSLYVTTDAINLYNKAILNMVKCSLGQKHVEAMVGCDKDQCAVQKLRKSLSDTRPESLTGFEHSMVSSGIAKDFPAAIISQYEAGDWISTSNPTERFLSNTSSLPFVQQIAPLETNASFVDLSLIPPEIFSRRLSLVLNTYYQLSSQTMGYFGGLSSNLSNYGPDTLPATDINAYLPSNLSATSHTFSEWWTTFSNEVYSMNYPFIGATTTAKVTTTHEIFVSNNAWIALLFISSSIIFVTGGVALVLKRMTLGPEIFGFVTSMTYDNPYVKLSGGTLGGGTTLDAMERAKLLKDVKVYIGDVRGDEEIGHIAMAAGVPMRKLERGRLYA
ncbi:hypothetical protein K504DRAFT_502244 [Pleomassaria siparia CBS 279.74]|uniref:Uncharacterized protein n=1 Tax=Pleomassaria siparia CBS 279.74 TaxID=1314801 RepID=A0A6G1K9M8_9PLEO|nr:hypothetical protein K504DRAFT_502244 [Pleomassaria siparia CBS 279.74]